MPNKIANEYTAYEIGSMQVDYFMWDRLVSKRRAIELGCEAPNTYSDNQLVPEIMLSVPEIPLVLCNLNEMIFHYPDEFIYVTPGFKFSIVSAYDFDMKRIADFRFISDTCEVQYERDDGEHLLAPDDLWTNTTHFTLLSHNQPSQITAIFTCKLRYTHTEYSWGILF